MLSPADCSRAPPGNRKLSQSDHGRLVPLLVFVDTGGNEHLIELLDEEVSVLAEDLAKLRKADRDQRELWKLELGNAI